ELVITAGPGLGSVFPLSKPWNVLGREHDVDIPLVHSSVSRHHAKIERLPDGAFRVTDLNSTNGIEVNGRVAQTAILSHGDRLQIGDIELTFATSDAAAQRRNATNVRHAAPVVGTLVSPGAQPPSQDVPAAHRPAAPVAPVALIAANGAFRHPVWL